MQAVITLIVKRVQRATTGDQQYCSGYETGLWTLSLYPQR